MKNLRQSITFWDYIVRFCPAILSTSLSSLNLCSFHLSFGIFHDIVNSFSIYSSTLQYERFLVMNFINKLVRNLLTLSLVVSKFTKYWANA